MNQINGLLMSGDLPVALIEKNQLKILRSDCLPYYFRRNGDLLTWIQSRVIDGDRVHSRLLKKALQLQRKDELSATMAVRAACITDNYWIKLDTDTLTYEDIRFKTDTYSDLALAGDLEVFSQRLDPRSSHTPELTNIGNFEKGWKLVDGVWWLSKQGSPEQLFSEFFCAQLGRFLGMDMAVYRLNEDYIMSEDFTKQEMNFEPAAALIGDQTDDYTLNYQTLKNLNPDCGRQYLDLLYLDAIVRNPHRHGMNYGILRSRTTGKVLGMAPNFDNNLSLIAMGYPRNLDRSQDRLIDAFREFLIQNQIEYNPPQFTESVLRDIMESIPISVNASEIITFLMNGQVAFVQACGNKY